MNIRTRDEGRYHQREMLDGDKMVCWLTVIDHPMRIGAAQVRMAGIGGVETHREYRMKGHMRALFDDTLQYMTKEGYDVSMLFGIPNFYPKFGYAVCLAAPKLTLQTRDAERASAHAMQKPCKTRAFVPADLPAIIDLYNQRNATRTCSLVRAPEHFKGFHKGTWWDQRAEAVTLEDEQGHFAGYAAWDKSEEAVNVVEAETADESRYPALLSAFARRAIDKRCGHISLYMPPDHPFAQFAQRYGCEWSIRHTRDSDGMLRIINQASLFDKLRPELERRMARSRLQQGPGALTLKTNLGATTLSLTLSGRDSKADCLIELPQDKLMQLVSGYRSARDLLNNPDVQTRAACGNVAPLLDTLFPQCHPYVWLADQF